MNHFAGCSSDSFQEYLDKDLCWVQVSSSVSIQASPPAPRPILFLDRDGVLIEDTGYLHRIGDVRFIEGAESVVLIANSVGCAVVIVTNQSGIGRGYYSWADFARVNSFILETLARRGARVDAVLACAHHSNGIGAYESPDHYMRKPHPGMLLRAAGIFNADLSRSIVVGDRVTDLVAGERAGLRKGFLVLTGHGRESLTELALIDSTGISVDVIESIKGEALIRAVSALGPA